MAQNFRRNCEVCESNSGLFFCYECQQFLCKMCRSMHDKFSQNRNHTIKSIENVDWLGFKNSFHCNNHDQEYIHSCITCSSLVCSKCVTTGHKYHEFADIKETIAKERSHAKQRLANLKEKINAFVEGKDKSLSKELDLKQSMEMSKKKLYIEFDKIEDIISRLKHIAEVQLSDFENLQRKEISLYIKNMDCILKKYCDFYSRMDILLNEKQDKLFYIGYKRLLLELDNQDDMPEQPSNVDIPHFDDSNVYLQIFQQIRPRIEHESSCCNYTQKEREVQNLVNSNEETELLLKRKQCEIQELEKKLFVEQDKSQGVLKDFIDLERLNERKDREIKRLESKLLAQGKESQNAQNFLEDLERSYESKIEELENTLWDERNQNQLDIEDLKRSNDSKLFEIEKWKEKFLTESEESRRLRELLEDLERSFERHVEEISEERKTKETEVNVKAEATEKPPHVEQPKKRTKGKKRIKNSIEHPLSGPEPPVISGNHQSEMDPIGDKDSSYDSTDTAKYICVIHKEEFTDYCKCHAIPICNSCIQDHDKCNTDYMQPVINEMEYSDIKEQYNKCKSKVNRLSSITFQVLNIALPTTQNEDVNPSPLMRRQKGSALATCSMGETTKYCKDEIIKILNSHIETMEEAEIISENSKTIAFMTMHAYKEKMKICIQTMQADVEQYRRKSEIKEPGYTLDINLLHKGTIDFILQFLYRSISFTLSSLSSDCNILNSIRLTKQMDLKIDDKRSKYNFPGCTIFKNGQIAITDPAENRLIFINCDGKQTLQNIKNKPYGIVALWNNEFAITLYRQRAVCFIDWTSEMKVMKFAECGSLGGIAVANKSLIVRLNGFGFYRIDAKGNIIDKIPIDYEDFNMQNVCCTNEKLFFAKWNENKVYCSDFRGNIFWTFQNEKVLQAPVGITVDEQELVYVIGQHSKNVVVISPCGNYFRELIFNIKPCAIHYELSTKQLLVCGFDGKILLFKMHKGKMKN